jgi:micrococcal nuclease
MSIEDGDSITIMYNNSFTKIRIYGIDAPEGTQTYGDISKTHLRYLISNKTLLIKERYQDRFGRTVADVFISDSDIGLEMIRAGMAWHFVKYSNDPAYKEAEQLARRNKVGLWGLPNPIPPWNYRNKVVQPETSNTPISTSLASGLSSTRTTTQVSSQALSQPSDSTTVYVTKTGTKYHKAGCTYLRRSSIPMSSSDAVNSNYSPCSVCNPSSGGAASLSTQPVTTESSYGISGSSNSSSSGGGQCMATTKKGTRCKRNAKAGSNYCWQHG